MRKLEFIGTVQASKQEPVIPGRDDLFLKPEDWPQQLAPGLLNAGINGFPEGFDEIGKGDGLDRLDEGKFRAALVIPQRKIVGSILKPDADHPTRGFAQAWRAELQVIATGQRARCWALRVIGSDAPRQIDIAHPLLFSRRVQFDIRKAEALSKSLWTSEDKKRCGRLSASFQPIRQQ